MALPIHYRFSQFIRKRGVAGIEADIRTHQVLRIGMYTPGCNSKLTHVICMAAQEHCPADVPWLDLTLDFQELRTKHNTVADYLSLTRDGAFCVRTVDYRVTNGEEAFYRVWREKRTHDAQTGTVIPFVLTSAIPQPERRPLCEDPNVLVRPKHFQLPPPSPSGLDTHQKKRTTVQRGDVALDVRVGQSFSLTGMVTVELDPSEHTEDRLVLLENEEIEGVINRALKRAYGSRLKTLRVRITGT